MSWFKEQKLTWFQSLCWNVLRQGPIPLHVAFIMDGNRRFATKKNMKSIDGHIQGFEKLAQTLEWCFHLGIREVSVYAFSIENFKRSDSEVNGLMELAESKLLDLLEDKEKIEERGICIRVAGDLSLLPKNLQKVIAEVVLMTEHNDRVFLNVCLSYTSRHEVCSAMDDLAEGVRNKIIEPSDINEAMLSSCMLVESEPDLLIRTSGEIRLSDFLLWQSVYSVLGFLKVLWPEFNIWHLFIGILFYQFNCKHVLKTKTLHKALCEKLEYTEDWSNALAKKDPKSMEPKLQTERIEEISPSEDIKLLALYRNERDQRRSQFLQFMKQRRRERLMELKNSSS